MYQSGDIVYYRRASDNTWKGPVSVIGIDGQQVLLKTASSYIRVHPCNLQLQNINAICNNDHEPTSTNKTIGNLENVNRPSRGLEQIERTEEDEICHEKTWAHNPEVGGS